MLRQISLFVSLVGVLVLLIVCEGIETEEFKIGMLNESFIEEKVKVVGTIEKIFTSENLIVIDLKDETGMVKVVVFSDYVDVWEGDVVQVEGEVREFNGELEIGAKVISVVAENN